MVCFLSIPLSSEANKICMKMLALFISRSEFIVIIFSLDSSVEHSVMIHQFEKESFENFGRK